MSNKKSIIKKKSVKKEISHEEVQRKQEQEEFKRQQLEYKKKLEEESQRKILEEKKKEMVEEIKAKLYKLNRNLNIAVEKDKLLQQKISEMQDDIDYYKEQLASIGIIYKDDDN
jgi:hypothetical protein